MKIFYSHIGPCLPQQVYSILKTFFTLIAFLICIQTNIYSEIRYVSKTGSSTPPFLSWEDAADSIMECVNISNTGDTIYVGNGVYKEQVVMISGLALIGSGIDSSIIDTRDFAVPGSFYTVIAKDKCILKNFQIRVSNLQDNNYLGVGIAIQWSGQRDIALVEGNLVMNAGTGITSNSMLSTIKSNIIKISDRGILFGDVAAHYIVIIEDNLIEVRQGPAISIDFGSKPYIANNICIGGGFGGSYSGLNEIYNNLFIGGGAALSDTTEFINNIITRNPSNAIGIQSYGTIRNNAIVNVEKAFHSNTPSNPVIKYNNVWQYNLLKGAYVPEIDSTNIFQDPMFLSDTSDFHLQMYSPLIDAGDPAILDIDSSRSDIGVYGGPLGESYQYLDLAPREPRGVTAMVDSNNSFITVKWNKNTESDFKNYNLFSDTVSNFTADSLTFIGSLTDTFFIHNIPSGPDKFFYKLSAVDSQGNQSALSEEAGVILTSAGEEPLIVESYKLYQNYPNPFNPKTRIGYKLKEYSYVKLRVYDIKGEEVTLLVNENQAKGYYETEFDASMLSSGIYLYRIDIRNENNIPVYTEMKKMLLIK